MIFQRGSTRASALLVWAITAGVAQAQSEPAISIPPIRVLDKQYREYRIGDDFKVNLSPADLKQAGGANALRLRIIRGSRVELLGSLRYPASDGCLIYKGGFFLAQEYNGGLRVQFLDKRAVVFTNRWLSSGAGDKLADQHFVLVLERGGTEAKEILKLRPEDAEAYFDKGFEFVVKSPQRPPQPSLIARLFEQEKVDRVTSGAEVAAIAREAPPRTRCLVFSPLSFAGEMTLIAERCAPSAEVEGDEIQQVAFGGELRGSGGAVRLNLGDP